VVTQSSEWTLQKKLQTKAVVKKTMVSRGKSILGRRPAGKIGWGGRRFQKSKNVLKGIRKGVRKRKSLELKGKGERGDLVASRFAGTLQDGFQRKGKKGGKKK